MHIYIYIVENVKNMIMTTSMNGSCRFLIFFDFKLDVLNLALPSPPISNLCICHTSSHNFDTSLTTRIADPMDS